MSKVDVNNLDFDNPEGNSKAELDQLMQKVRHLRAMYSDLENLDNQMKKINDEIQNLESNEIPDMMEVLGIKDMTLEDGKKLKLADEIRAGLPTLSAIQKQKDPDKKAEMEERRSSGIRWLRENGAESIIKNVVTVEFSKGQDNLVGDFIGKAAELGLPAVRDESIHAQTLVKFIKEKLKSVDKADLPMDTLGVYCGRRAKVK